MLCVWRTSAERIAFADAVNFSHADRGTHCCALA
jgi:hypothetical protein